MTATPSLPVARDLVAGDWDEAAMELPLKLEDPATARPVAAARASSPERVERALQAADEAAVAWAEHPPEARAATLEAVAEALDARIGEILTLEAFATGVPIRQARPLGAIVAGSFRLAAGRLREGAQATTELSREDGRRVEVHRLPWGPAACLVPWNAPAPMAAHKVANALAAGCPALLKPSEYAPYGSQVLAEVIAEVLAEHGAPAGAFQLLMGGAEVGARLVADDRVRAVSFTGGGPGGRGVAAACALGVKPVQLELGGNNPLVVMPDADVGAAARVAADLLTTLNGQWCRALGRLIVPTGTHDELVAAIGERLRGLRAGPALDEATDLGPLIHSDHRELVERQRDDLDGRVRTWTPVPGQGNFVSPALVTGVPAERATEEIFGPVATVHPYASVEEAISLANGTGYGLEGYVAGGDERRALAVARRIRAGEVKVNGSSVMSLHLFAPRPAWGRSGLGEEGTSETLRFFTNPQVVGVEGGFALHSREDS